MYKIYKLVFQGEIIYIGSTSQPLNNRRYRHYADAFRKKNLRFRNNNSISRFIRNNFSIRTNFYDQVKIFLIEESENKTFALSQEKYWINFYKSEKLLNKYHKTK